MTLNTIVNDNPCDVSVDTEKKMEKVQEKIIPEEDQQEKAMVSGSGDKEIGEDVCNLPIVPESGTATASKT